MNTAPPELSIVVPCFNEEGNIQAFLDRLRPAIASVTGDYEVIFVDDGSRDKTFSIIARAHQVDPKIRALRLSRNFGHQAALFAGMRVARGRAVVTMDADLQHPPEVIPELVALWRSGAQIVQTVRTDAAGTGWFKGGTSRLFYALLSRLGDVRVPAGGSDFRLMDQAPLRALLNLSESGLFIRGLVQWIGFSVREVHFQAAQRSWGSSQYTLKKMLRLAVHGIVGFSDRPLYLSFFLALGLGAIVSAYGVYVLIQFWGGHVVPGWTSSILLIGVTGSAILLNQGIQGVYLARVLGETKRRPLYIVAEDLDEKR